MKFPSWCLIKEWNLHLIKHIITRQISQCRVTATLYIICKYKGKLSPQYLHANPFPSCVKKLFSCVIYPFNDRVLRLKIFTSII